MNLDVCNSSFFACVCVESTFTLSSNLKQMIKLHREMDIYIVNFFRSEIIGQKICICKFKKKLLELVLPATHYLNISGGFFVFKSSYQSYFRVEEPTIVIIASPNMVPLVFLGHLVLQAQKVPEDFLVCREEMVFLD